MLRKDYIQRQFEEFGKVLATILGYKQKGDITNFELEIDKAVKTFTGFEITDLLNMTDESFKELIKASQHLKPDQVKTLADLLYERSFVFDAANNQQQLITTLERSYFLYQWYAGNLTTNEFNIEVNYRMSLIHKIINPPNPQ